jgi:hypothetical protein
MSNSRLFLLFILLLATFFRFYQLPQLPAGLNFDEAGNGVAAAEILTGAPRIWWRIGGGKEPLWPLLVALSTAMWGYIPRALRLPAVMVGILSVAAVYPLTMSLFRNRQAYPIASLTMLGLAISGWHLHFSRLGFRAILLPLLSTLAFYFFWAGLTGTARDPLPAAPRFWRLTRRDLYFVLAAFFLALAIYSYLAARLLPVVLIVFVVLQWLMNRLWAWSDKGGRGISRPDSDSEVDRLDGAFSLKPAGPTVQQQQTGLLGPLVRLFALMILFLSPLIVYFLLNPNDFAARSEAVSIFNPAWNNGDLVGTAWRTLAITVGTYLGLPGDANPLVNLPYQSALPHILVPFFVLGLATSLYRAVRPTLAGSRQVASPSIQPPVSAHLFLICWWVIMLLPAILAPEGAPHHLRLIGTIIPTYTLVALGFIAAITLLVRLVSYVVSKSSPAQHLLKYTRRAAYLLIAICFVLLAGQTYANYFVLWPLSVDFTLPFDLYAVRLATTIAQAPDNATYVIPMDIRAGQEARHYTLDYLLAPYPSAAYTYLPVDERQAQASLTQSASGKDELRLVRWRADKHVEADAKEIVTYLLKTATEPRGRESFPVYDVESFYLRPSTDPQCTTGQRNNGMADCSPFVLPHLNQPLRATFDSLISLDAAYVQPRIDSSDRWLPVAVTFSPLAPMEVDYKASVRLLSPVGERVAQKDRVLAHDFHQGTSLWPAEPVNEYYLVPLPTNLSPGQYTVVLVIYHPDTLAALAAGGVVEVPLGTVQIR